MGQINEEYIEEYIRGLLPRNGSNLVDMEDYAKENHIPIVEPEVAQFLKVLLKIKKPINILEIGTAIGYSAIVMAENTSDSTKITTIERRKDLIEIAIDNIKNANQDHKIKIIEGEAEEIFQQLESKFDFIFLDAAKGQYLEFFNHCTRLLEAEGIIVCDNVLFRGMVASDKLVIRRKKTIVKRLRTFLQYINEIKGYTSSIIPIGDGVAISYREE